MSWSVSGVAYIVNTVVKHRACARWINFGRPRASFPREISKPLQRWHMHKHLTAVLHCRKAVCYGSKIFPPETRPAHNGFRNISQQHVPAISFSWNDSRPRFHFVGSVVFLCKIRIQ